jgi:hypothetical protein
MPRNKIDQGTVVALEEKLQKALAALKQAVEENQAFFETIESLIAKGCEVERRIGLMTNLLTELRGRFAENDEVIEKIDDLIALAKKPLPSKLK